MKQKPTGCRTLLAAAFPALAVGILSLFPSHAQGETGFVPLFDGRTLAGWTGDSRLWRVEDGAIIGSTRGASIEQNSFLVTEREYSDFVLKAMVKLDNHNSGIQFRSERLTGNSVAGYQADIAEADYFGMLYEERKRGFLPYWQAMTPAEKAAVQKRVKPGGWNEFVITCQGDHITLSLNGFTTCDIADPEGARRGVIALQLHTGPAMTVSFKDIRIRDTSSPKDAPLMPDYDGARREKLGVLGGRFRTPDGFTVEEVATDELVGSVINLTFDPKGRPAVSSERGGIRILLDDDGDGVFDRQQSYSEDVQTAMGIHYLGPGDLLVQSKGAKGPGLYRLRDTDGDEKADDVSLVMASNGGIGEHGPHTILTGADGYRYILYGNHAFPKGELQKDSPSRGLEEDHLLPRFLDPRGHANRIRAPGGTIHRVSPGLEVWSQFAGGYRNPFDMAIDRWGEVWTFDADMEWDLGLPWYRPIRMIHVIPGGDYGWRTGSSKMPFYYIDTLPSVDDIGRGSPVGICFYEHNVYPERFRGALFSGDWTRGRIRVLFPRRSGATYAGKSLDFVLGEPLNVTDMDVGPDGFLYFTVGGRNTHGGLFRVRYDGPTLQTPDPDPILAALDQPMPRSAWGKVRLTAAKVRLGERWETGLRKALANPSLSAGRRTRALEALQVLGPQPSRELLTALAGDRDAEVRAAAIGLLGLRPFGDVRRTLAAALDDPHPYVARRACESLIRAGLNEEVSVRGIVDGLLRLLDHEDRTLRYAARLALLRTPRRAWARRVLEDSVSDRPRGAFEGLLALVYTQENKKDGAAIIAKLEEYADESLTDEELLDYLRVLQLALLRVPKRAFDAAEFGSRVGPVLLSEFPRADARVNRELQVALAYFQTPGAVEALLNELTPAKSQEDQIHTVYALRTISEGWTEAQRTQLIDWFDDGREIRGAASMEGFIDNLWESSMNLLPDRERKAAEEHRASVLKSRQVKALALLEEIEGERTEVDSDLAQMSFEELSEYLEFDPMSYRPGGLEAGQRVFMRARCASCHVFGSIGRGGGPDLSTVTSRFRRRDILESIMYPSSVISDQYIGVELDLKDLSTVSGMVVSEGEESLTIITVLGERVEIASDQIERRSQATSSIMPEGLLGTMTLGELVNLIKFLERGADL